MSAVTVTATVEMENSPPRVRLDVVDTGSPALTSVNVVRVGPDGSATPVRTFDGNPLALIPAGGSRAGLAYDHEAPFGVSHTYRTIEGGVVTPSESVTVEEPWVWLVHPQVPELSTRIEVADVGRPRRRVSRGVFDVAGRDTPIVVTDGKRKAPESTVIVRTRTFEQIRALLAALDDSSPLLLNVPAAFGWRLQTCYVSVGDVDEDPLLDYAADANQYVSLPYFVVGRPAGGSQAERTWADVVAECATWADVLAKYPTWADVLAPTT